MNPVQKEVIDFAKLISLAQSLELSPDGEFLDAADAFRQMQRRDFQLSELQVKSVRQFETARSGNCPSCGLFPSKGRHAQKDTAGHVIEDCDLKCALDLLPSFYVVKMNVKGGITAVHATTWRIASGVRGARYRLMTTTLPHEPVPDRFEERIDLQLLSIGEAGDSWEPMPAESDSECLRRRLASLFGATKSTVSALGT